MTWTLSTLKTAIQDYSESTESSFVTNLPNFIKTAEERILKGVQLDDFIKNVTGTATASSPYIGSPSDYLSSNSLAVIDSSSNYNYLQLKHPSFIRDFTPASSTTGLPKYYAMFGGATGLTDTTSGSIVMAPTPDANYVIKIYGNALPTGLETETSGTYVSRYFPQGLLYACLVEAYGFLKGPQDMLTLYEQKYKQELQKFASMQIGRRRRDDYTDGTIRIPIESPPQ